MDVFRLATAGSLRVFRYLATLGPHAPTVRSTWSPPDGAALLVNVVNVTVVDAGGTGGLALINLKLDDSTGGIAHELIQTVRIPGTAGSDRSITLFAPHLLIVRPGESINVVTYNGTSGNMLFAVNMVATLIPIAL
jgi:hypothetical protein